MNTWKLALVGLATLSTSALATPVLSGSAAALKSSTKVVSVPDLGTNEVVVVINKQTGEVSAQAADGSLVATTETTVGSLEKACYGGPGCGPYAPPLAYGPVDGYIGYGYPAVPPTVIEEDELIIKKRYRRVTPAPAYGYGPAYGPGPGYGPYAPY